MASVKPRPYLPDVPIPPGATIQEMLIAKGITQAGLAQRMKRPANKVNEIISGKRAITVDTAAELELVLGLPAYFWLELQRNYELARKRTEAEQRLQDEAAARKRFPVQAMVKLGWLKRARAPLEQTHALLGFFAVTSFSQLDKPSVYAPAFRKSPSKEACPYALAAWLRKGELEAAEVETGPYDAKGLKGSLASLRALSLVPAEVFGPQLVSLCAAHGVAVVLVPHLPRSSVCGAAYWLGEKAVVQLSLRFGTDDQFWFGFFHEVGHILLHSKKETFLDDDDFRGDHDDQEHQANDFARKKLIPNGDFACLKGLDIHEEEVIRQFSRDIGIAPGIVVGRLQYEGLLPYSSRLNRLKAKLALSAVCVLQGTHLTVKGESAW
jgi:addiction module HigA family antidote